MFFADSLLRFVRSELGSVDIIRVPDARALKELTTVDKAPQVCVLEESFAEAPEDDLDRVVAAAGDALISVAYYKPDLALALMGRVNSAGQGFGFVPLGGQMDVWLSALRLQLCGERYVPGELLDALDPGHQRPTEPRNAKPGTTQPRPGVAANLTDREMQVLELVSSGKQNKSIADELGLSEHTVKLHIHHVLSKLNVRNRTGATHWYLQNRGGDPAPGWAAEG